ncbi:hypothetical protein EV13_0122 [Prochlorococcus sp. MIT 0702]|nr:hypothetical protein EV12_0365 [Prochlorococcus sp. MIT 0701]KGG30617.1 hypothetical protein EV13_0122 [Prochlorococcus sp. MIT 0702]
MDLVFKTSPWCPIRPGFNHPLLVSYDIATSYLGRINAYPF